MSFDPFSVDLPVRDVLHEVQSTLARENTAILSAPPGAGKSTLLPLALLDEPFLAGKKIIMLEPRRLAARTIAWRMSDLLGEACGTTVGYRVRFESVVSPSTRLEVVTEGILTRMLQSDNALENTGLVIFDEFHERSIHADLALALCRQSQELLRPDLRILVMSATLNITGLTKTLKAPVIESSGRQYPVEILYGHDADQMLLPEMMARVILQAVSEHKGDVLAFLPGEGEIRKCEELLKTTGGNFSLHPLFGQLSHQEQDRAIKPDRHGRRKIVLATSIAETSLTIEGIRIVVDSGFSRTSRFDPSSGLSKLETIRITKDAADQRAGRAGRLSSGVCYRMWTLATHGRLQEHRLPEISSADLAPLLLELAAWGAHEADDLLWITPPPRAAMSQASDTLHNIGALENKKITPHGKQIARLGVHPRLAHMMLLARTQKIKSLAADVAAILEERDPLSREDGVDLNLRVEALRRARRSGKPGNRFSRIAKAAASYLRLLEVSEDNDAADPFETGLLVAHAFPERIASARPGNNTQFQLANGRYAQFGHKDDLAHERWIAVAGMDLRDTTGKIFLAAPLNPSDLRDMVKAFENISWDARRGGLIAAQELRIGSIVLQSKPLQQYDTEKSARVIGDAISRDWDELVHVDERFTQLQNRVESLRAWNGPERYPDVSTEALRRDPHAWLSAMLKEVRSPADIKKISLSEALMSSLDWNLQQEIEKLAPQTVSVPSGSRIRLAYTPNGGAPVLAVRLQEVFGLMDTPVVNNGKNKVVLHLLSPGYKPVQVTSDLRSFWNNLYFEVRRELQRRYPKHSWPEDPLNAAAVAKGRSHK